MNISCRSTIILEVKYESTFMSGINHSKKIKVHFINEGENQIEI